MAQIVFELASGRDGIIQLRDCEFTEWWKHVYRLNKPRGVSPDPCKSLIRYKDRNRKLIDMANSDFDLKRYEEEAIQSISSGVKHVQDISFPWTRGQPSMGMDWDVTNELHRGFTTLSLTECTDRVDLTHDEKNALMHKQYNFNGPNGREFLLQYSKTNRMPEFPFDNYEVREARADFLHHIHKINNGVHNIESKCRVSQRRLDIEGWVYPEHKVCNLPLLDWDTKDLIDDRTDIVKSDFNLGDIAMWCVDNDPHWNVYDLKNILGKDYLVAYNNYDDPGEWDICNHYKTTKGGFEIKPFMHDVANRVLVPWIRDEWGYTAATPEIVSPIQIGHIDSKELLNMCTPNESNSWDVSRNNITKVDLVE